MQTSEYFDLNIYEGTDIFNPLTVENDNIEKIDEQMFLNSIATVGQATELKSGTVHALTRENPDASMFRFVATSKFDRGDTFTVDGIQVTGLRTDGKALDDGAYVINANVLCCLTGTVLTLFVATGDVAKADDADRLGGELPSYYGTATDVQQANTVAQAAGVLANQVNSNLTIKTTIDILNTSIPIDTPFENIIKMIAEKVFPKSKSGTFNTSASNVATIDIGFPIKTLRIVGMFAGYSCEWTWNENNPTTTIRNSAGPYDATTPIPNTTDNNINSVSGNTFTFGKMESTTLTYYVNE